MNGPRGIVLAGALSVVVVSGVIGGVPSADGAPRAGRVSVVHAAPALATAPVGSSASAGSAAAVPMTDPSATTPDPSATTPAPVVTTTDPAPVTTTTPAPVVTTTDPAPVTTTTPAPVVTTTDPAPVVTTSDPGPVTTTTPAPVTSTPAPGDPAPSTPAPGTPAPSSTAGIPAVPVPTTPAPATPGPSPSRGHIGTPTPTPTPTPTGHPVLRLVQSVQLVKDVNGDGRVGAGDGVVFRATVTNQGTATATHLFVSDLFLTRHGLSVSCGATSLAVGKSTTCSAPVLLVTAGLASSGSLSNDMTPHGTTPSGAAIVGSTDSLTVALVAPAPTPPPSVGPGSGGRPTHAPHARAPRPVKQLGLSQYRLSYDDVNGNGALTAGETMVIGFQAVNQGTVTLYNLQIVDGRMSDDKVAITCSRQTLAPGQSASCSTAPITITQFEAKVLGTGFGTNYAYAATVDSTGSQVRSPTTTLHQGYYVSDVQGTALASTGTSVGAPIGLGLLLLVLGGLFLAGSRLTGRARALVLRRPRLVRQA